MSLEMHFNTYQPLVKGETFVANNFKTYKLPENLSIVQIVITANLTADVGGINANTFLKSLKLTIEGQDIEDWGGEVQTDAPASGIANLRIINAVLNGIEDIDNIIIIDLQKFGPLPPGTKKAIEIETNSVANIAVDATATNVSGTYSIYYLAEEPDEEDIWLSRIVKREKIEIGSASSYTFRPIQCPRSYACSFIIMRIDDSGTLSDSVISNILIKKNNRIIRNVEYQLLKNQIQTASRYTIPSGYLVLDMDELEWDANELEFEITTNSATDLTLNIQYMFTKPVE